MNNKSRLSSWLIYLKGIAISTIILFSITLNHCPTPNGIDPTNGRSIGGYYFIIEPDSIKYNVE